MTSKVTKSVAEKYTIHNDHEYATICLSSWGPDKRPSGSNYYGGEILINSSFDSFCHTWTACGEPFKEFLIGIEMDYFMKKCLGRRAYVFDGERTFENAIDRVLKSRQDLQLSKEDARELYGELQDCKGDLVESADSFMQGIDRAMRHANQAQEDVMSEAYEMICEKQNPQCVGFWEKLWPVFEEQLKLETKEGVI